MRTLFGNLVIICIVLCAAATASAESMRCKSATIDSTKISPSESAEISALWRDFGDVGAGASDGPLGCPVGAASIEATDPVSKWTGVGQQFQRGWILIGRDFWHGFEIVAAHGLGGWLVWWKGPQQKNLGAQLLASDERAPFSKYLVAAPGAQWSHAGSVMMATGGVVALWQCYSEPCATNTASGWTRVTPVLSAISPPFDPAARLDRDTLAKPSVSAAPRRLDAVFPKWLPCVTVSPAGAVYPGEDDVARATVMFRRSDACPLTGQIPRNQIVQWIGQLTFPADWFPGTDTSDGPCARHGDLDVTLVQLLHLVYPGFGALDSNTRQHLIGLLSGWGGKPRSNQYVVPHGYCLGFGVVETENHILLQETARYLINRLAGYPNAENVDWLLRYLQQLARRDFYEFNSLPYERFDMKGLLALHDYGEPSISTAAMGIIDWLFIKHALSANLDRDDRPYRRQPLPERYANIDWWGSGSATIITASQSGLIVGPLQHAHPDIDLQLHAGKDPDDVDVLTAVSQYPNVATISENFLVDMVDIADTQYRLPDAIRSWLEQRYVDDSANRLLYLQAFHHHSSIADDPRLFLQRNEGTELASGNRNWTMIAGGTAVAPGDPGNPPEDPGVAIGDFEAGGWLGDLVHDLYGADISPKALAANQQHKALWDSQPAVVRPTMLIPTAVGLDRSQTIRFGAPAVTSESSTILSRLCVAQGFMCGFDLEMPTYPFPVKDASDCPLAIQDPVEFDQAASLIGLNSNTAEKVLGCLVPPVGNARGWMSWQFEKGNIVQAPADPPLRKRRAAMWLDGAGDTRVVHVKWETPSEIHDWFNLHIYRTSVATSSDDAPSGDFAMVNVGDPNNRDTYDYGEGSFKVAEQNTGANGVRDDTWYAIVEGCDPSHALFGTHSCHANILPRLSVNVADRPKQPFSCKAWSYREGAALVMEVGESCSQSPYGFFVYVWDKPCDEHCPLGASNYGFVVVAPSRGWHSETFANMVEMAILGVDLPAPPDANHLRQNMVSVPLAPPVVLQTGSDGGAGRWAQIGPPSSHVITFRWKVPDNQPAILADSLTPAAYGPLLFDLQSWPTAFGHTVNPDLAGAGSGLLHSDGTGCFSVMGLPTARVPDPTGLVVDLRNAQAPSVLELKNSQLQGACQ